MIAALLLISSAWLARTTNPDSRPADEARLVASAVQGLVVRQLEGPATDDLSGVLRLIASGDVRVLSGQGFGASDSNWRFAPPGSSLDNLAYLVVIGSD